MASGNRCRYPESAPSLSTIQRVLKRHHLTSQAPKPSRRAYRPHPLAPYPDAVHATDIITRWITGGEVVQTFNTVDVYSNDAYSTSHATKTAATACEHLLQTWQQLGVPDMAQFDNESAFSGGHHPWVLGRVVRLCLYMGIEVLFIPLGEADYNSPVETFNHLWAQRFWGLHHFTRRRDVSRVQRTFLAWYRSHYIAPRQPDTPEHMRLGAPMHTLATRDATGLPHRLPICAGRVHAVRRVSPEGWVRFLNQSLRVGKQLPWALCLAHAGDGPPASEHVVSSPCRSAVETTQNSCGTVKRTGGSGTQTIRALHAARQPRARDQPLIDNGSKPAKIAAQLGS